MPQGPVGTEAIWPLASGLQGLRPLAWLSGAGLEGGGESWLADLARALSSWVYSSPPMGTPSTPNPHLVTLGGSVRQGWESSSAQETMRPQVRRSPGSRARSREAGDWAPTRDPEPGSETVRRRQHWDLAPVCVTRDSQSLGGSVTSDLCFKHLRDS